MIRNFFMAVAMFTCCIGYSSASTNVCPADNSNEGSGSGIRQNVCMADPTILVEGGTYYLYGTSRDSNNGFESYYSTDMKSWEGPVRVLTKGEAFGTTGFWAPQVLKLGDRKFAMIYTADEQIAVAWAESPLGPFRNDAKLCIADNMRRIDPFLFKNTDGRTYLYHVRLDHGNKIYAQSIAADLESTDPATLTKAIEATLSWENTDNASWPVTEGPTVVRHEGKYYLFYSANDFRNRDYAVGYAVADSPAGPWKKHPEPIISHRNTGLPGTGHGDIFIGKDGKCRYVFHAHNSRTEVAPRKTYVVELTFDSAGVHIDPTAVSELTTSF